MLEIKYRPLLELSTSVLYYQPIDTELCNVIFPLRPERGRDSYRRLSIRTRTRTPRTLLPKAKGDWEGKGKKSIDH